MKDNVLGLHARELDLRLHAAAAIAREAGAIARLRFADRGSFTVGLKGPQDFLTEVDGEVERLVAGRLGALFPSDGFIGEEGASKEPEATDGPIWVVDPIDGTANFARGLPHFCVSIGLVAQGRIAAGVICDPVRDELFVSRRGGGASLNGAAIRVSATQAMSAASVEVGWNMRSGPQTFTGILRRVISLGAGVTRLGSGALALAYVAAGRTDAYIEHRINSWDCVAGLSLVEEAGGFVSDFLANDGLRKGNALLACTPALRDPLAGIASLESVHL